MQTITPEIPFSFLYPTSDQQSGLFVRAKIYDVTTGTPVFSANVVMAEIQNGYYFGNFTGASGKTYLVISAVFTDGTYVTLDPLRGPEADVYKSADAPPEFSAFNYGSFDQNGSLSIAGNVYDVTTGTAIFQVKVLMAHIFAGVYFGAFDGILNNVYQVVKLVYTDMSYVTVDANFSPGSDSFQLFQPSVSNNVFISATLMGQNEDAILQGQAQSAILIASDAGVIVTGQEEDATLQTGGFDAILTG